MLIRDLPRHLQKKLATECDKEYEEWITVTGGKQFGNQLPVDSKQVFRLGWSKGVAATLRKLYQIRDKKSKYL